MAKKKKDEVNVDALNFKPILEEAVACSRLGRTIASFGAMLTNREKHEARLVYLLLKAGKELPEKTVTTAAIASEKKKKDVTYAQAVKWFAEKYPKNAEPLLAKLKEEYDDTETAVVYGIKPKLDFVDDYYIRVLVDILEIPKQDAAVMYHGAIKPHLSRMDEKEGLVSLVMK